MCVKEGGLRAAFSRSSGRKRLKKNSLWGKRWAIPQKLETSPEFHRKFKGHPEIHRYSTRTNKWVIP
jgi:hypothetical protein